MIARRITWLLRLRKETFLASILDVMSCLKAHGIDNVFILNRHGDNPRPIREASPGWRDERGINLEADSNESGANRE